ncbi:hypothetical protein BDV28DRAFT_132353 [Aspergillus coremiiformis]|uniref:chitinase n=1 Tax=Aspergillus coremiiformis TaxID=138285 RepID=A0A5N6ZCP8_9EURO|nr:hypothetical protein BDV28DRAFT_132353 [Aspergillus coremiiformis]
MAPYQNSTSKPGQWLWIILFGILPSILCVRANWASVPQTKHVIHHDMDPIDGQSPNTSLVRRDYMCGPRNPCSNGACCGSSGFCGYGPIYCGTGCVSNCDATAECGQYAKTPGKTCPLNTCCSQFGFCGTTKDFCGKGCQSNCVLNPKPPGGGSSQGILQNKVIGYYEAWMARRTCHKVSPTDLPLDALTHINFAFAYIEPSTYEVVTMDSATPASLFKDTTNVKSIKEDLSVFVSIGGWAFSDNGTQTQPIFGEIAADASKRQTFANNLVHFMQQYAFDGVDLDWEYPAAGDRGGKPEDTKNYVLLLKTLRETFDASGSKFGLSFTAPSSYWYLRWFDLPNMVKYADWINVMTYDLHGVWDQKDPIGSIVQGHTNLTEIKSALELFWRVEIPPAKLVLGFGFYGRSFTLANPSCTSPGCPFSGASNAGPCSNTGGMLAYYEIMSVLNGATAHKKRASINPTHDKAAAVKYFTFNQNQWVSYDDKETFKQKVDWADSVGLGGALIWASDLDDDKYSAHAGLLGRNIMSTPLLQDIDKALSNPKSIIQDLTTFNGQKCFKYSGKCVNLNDEQAMAKACGSGNTVVGWDDDGCGTKSCHCGKPICCPSHSAPQNCVWRGDNTGTPGVNSDCSAQCLPGEMNINGIVSSWGGGFTNDGDTDRCGRGYKAFCCPDPDYEDVIKGCSFAPCGSDCPTGKTSVFVKRDKCWVRRRKYCCPDPVELVDCHWVAGSAGNDCANAKCNATELQVDRATYGDTSSGCQWGRSKVACCTVKKAPAKEATCSADVCTLLKDYCPKNSDDDDQSVRRDLIPLEAAEDQNGGQNHLAKRGSRKIREVLVGDAMIQVIIAAYPSIGQLFTVRRGAQVLRQAFRLRSGYCRAPSLEVSRLPQTPDNKLLTQWKLETEHPVDKTLLTRWVEAASSGNLMSGKRAPFPPVRAEFWQDIWNTGNLKLAQRPAVGDPKGKAPATPSERCAEAFGSDNNTSLFLATEKRLNIAKGKVMMCQNPVSVDAIKAEARRAARADTQTSADNLLSSIQLGFTVFEYLRRPELRIRWNQVLLQMDQQLRYIEEDTSTPYLRSWWTLWTDDYFMHAQQLARIWARQAIDGAAAPFVEARNRGIHLQTHDMVMAALQDFENEIKNMKMPPKFHEKYPDNNHGEILMENTWNVGGEDLKV